jgi:hypothetical protein
MIATLRPLESAIDPQRLQPNIIPAIEFALGLARGSVEITNRLKASQIIFLYQSRTD